MKIKIGNEEKTLHELFEEYAVYFGFTSLSGAQQEFEQSAFVTDPKLSQSGLLRSNTQMVTVSQNPISGISLSLKCCFSLMCVPIRLGASRLNFRLFSMTNPTVFGT